MKDDAVHRGAVEIAVLGPLELSVDGQLVPQGAPRLRTMLVTLALSAGEPVSIDQLATAIWGDDLPNDARRTVQVYVTRLRQVLGPELIRTVPTGYVLMAEPDRVDALRFERLLDEAARAADPETERSFLADALELWRGDEPFEGARSAWLDRVQGRRLVDTRLVALERRIELDLASSRAAALVPELLELTARYPLRERFWGQLITALYRADRRADALEAYQRLQQLLAEELGIEPGHAVRQARSQVLSGDAAPGPAVGQKRAEPPRPRQLPASTGYFTGRSASLARLDALLPAHVGAAPTAVVISAIAGTAGVGKTALAVHWARRVAHRFPDGHLYVNLRGFDPSSSPMRPEEVISGFLSALGVSPHRIPADTQAQVALYRSLMAGKRMLVLLDNARDADHVRPLLPGAAGCVVVVTSRNQLADLITRDGAHLLNVDVLTKDEALRFLTTRLGPERVAVERKAAEEIIERCARLPLALTIVAARAVTYPDFPLAAVIGELRDAQGHLHAFADEDAATDLRAVFTASYLTLTPSAARLFRLLGLHPGPDISLPAAASLAGVSPAQAQVSLDELARIHMIVENVPGRYTFHDLLRAHAADLASTQESEDQRRAAIRRVLDHYLHTIRDLHTIRATTYQLNPYRDQPATPPIDREPGVIPEELGGRGAAALAWLAAEHAVLLATVRLAVDASLDTHAWLLAWAVSAYLARSGHWQEWAATQRIALGAAERLGDRSEQARAHRGLARAYKQLDRFDDAYTHLRHALRLCTQVDDRVGLGGTYLSLGHLFELRDDFRTALEHDEQALRLFRSINDVTGEALALNSVGWDHACLGDRKKALAFCAEALSLQQQHGDRHGEASTWDSLGYAHHHLGNFQQAIVCYQASLALRRPAGERYGEARTLIRLGDTQSDLGDTAAAVDAWERAVALLDEMGHPDADWARTRLEQHDILA